MAFLRRQSDQWADMPDDIPAGVELMLPHLLAEAAQIGLEIDQLPYQSLIALGAQRRQLIGQLPAEPGTHYAHSWETWGTSPASCMPDPTAGVGQSPAATAAWCAPLPSIPSWPAQAARRSSISSGRRRRPAPASQA